VRMFEHRHIQIRLLPNGETLRSAAKRHFGQLETVISDLRDGLVRDIVSGFRLVCGEVDRTGAELAIVLRRWERSWAGTAIRCVENSFWFIFGFKKSLLVLNWFSVA